MRYIQYVLILIAFLVSVNIQAQTITGGSGNCTVDADPNTISDLNTQDTRIECLRLYNTADSSFYYYVVANNIGSRWIKEEFLTQVQIQNIVSDTADVLRTYTDQAEQDAKDYADANDDSGTDNQTLSFVYPNIFISGGNSTDLSGLDDWEDLGSTIIKADRKRIRPSSSGSTDYSSFELQNDLGAEQDAVSFLMIQRGSAVSGTNFTDFGSALYTAYGGAKLRIGNYFSGDIRFLTSNSNERLTILSNGNVGIGNTSPSYTLEVDGTVGMSSLSDGSPHTELVTRDDVTGELGYDLRSKYENLFQETSITPVGTSAYYAGPVAASEFHVSPPGGLSSILGLPFVSVKYSGQNILNTIGTARSSSDWIMGYAVKANKNASGIVSSAGNVPWNRVWMQLGGSGFKLYGSGVQDVPIDSTISAPLRFSVDELGAVRMPSISDGSSHTELVSRNSTTGELGYKAISDVNYWTKESATELSFDGRIRINDGSSNIVIQNTATSGGVYGTGSLVIGTNGLDTVGIHSYNQGAFAAYQGNIGIYSYNQGNSAARDGSVGNYSYNQGLNAAMNGSVGNYSHNQAFNAAMNGSVGDFSYNQGFSAARDGSVGNYSYNQGSDAARNGSVGIYSYNQGNAAAYLGSVGTSSYNQGAFAAYQGSVGNYSYNQGREAVRLGTVGNYSYNQGNFAAYQGSVGDHSYNHGYFAAREGSIGDNVFSYGRNNFYQDTVGNQITAIGSFISSDANTISNSYAFGHNIAINQSNQVIFDNQVTRFDIGNSRFDVGTTPTSGDIWQHDGTEFTPTLKSSIPLSDFDDTGYWQSTDFSSSDIANWNTAYGWGDHSTAGYLTSEVDGSTTNELQTIDEVLTQGNSLLANRSINVNGNQMQIGGTYAAMLARTFDVTLSSFDLSLNTADIITDTGEILLRHRLSSDVGADQDYMYLKAAGLDLAHRNNISLNSDSLSINAPTLTLDQNTTLQSGGFSLTNEMTGSSFYRINTSDAVVNIQPNYIDQTVDGLSGDTRILQGFGGINISRNTTGDTGYPDFILMNNDTLSLNHTEQINIDAPVVEVNGVAIGINTVEIDNTTTNVSSNLDDYAELHLAVASTTGTITVTLPTPAVGMVGKKIKIFNFLVTGIGDVTYTLGSGNFWVSGTVLASYSAITDGRIDELTCIPDPQNGGYVWAVEQN